MKKIFAILLAALMLTGCSNSGSFSGSGTVHKESSSSTGGNEISTVTGSETSTAAGGGEKGAGNISSVESTSSAAPINIDNPITRLTDSNRWEDYRYNVKSITGETVDIVNSDIIYELWDHIWGLEHSSVSYILSEEPDILPTDELIMTSLLDDKEYILRAGYVPESYSSNTFLIIEGIESADTKYVCYEDFYRVFELMFNGLAERAIKGENFESVKDKITITNFDDCTFTGTAEVFERETLTTTKYSGTLTEEAARKVWELLTEIENTEPIVFDDDDSVGASSYSELVVRNTRVNKSWTVAEGILYEHPMEDGGPVVVAVGENYYYTFEIDGVFAHDRLDELIAEGIAREENIVWRETAEPKSAKPDIVVVENYCNYAWGYQNGGAFVDSEGNIYKFDLTDIAPVWGEEFVKVLEYRHFNDLLGEPVGKFDDVEKLREIAVLADKIPEDAKIKEDHRAYDAGQRTLYAMTSEHALVEIYSDGDYRRVNTDRSAKKIAKMWKNTLV